MGKTFSNFLYTQKFGLPVKKRMKKKTNGEK